MNLIVHAQGSVEVVNIENPAVQAYMADSTYFYDNDYSTSVIEQYNNTTLYGSHLDWPQGKRVKWTPTTTPDNIKDILITVSENANFSSPYTHHPASLDVNSYTIRNTIPHRTYYYKVEETRNDLTVTEVARGTFATTGQVRMIRVNGARNVRDLGGWPTSFGVPVKYGKIYRSANLDALNSEGKHDFITNLGVNAELDLRADVSYTASPVGPEVEYARFSNYMYYLGVSKLWEAYVNDFKWVIEQLSQGKVVDWHCKIGCDRCGSFTLLIEGLLGMSEADMCRDYELSTFSEHIRPRSYGLASSGEFRQMVPYIRTFGPADDLAQCFYNYWIARGMQASELDFFRNTMLGNGIYTAVNDVSANTVVHNKLPAGIYNLTGTRLNTLQPGFNIVVDDSGSVRKVWK